MIESNLDWLNRIPSKIDTVYLKQLLYHDSFNEVHRTYQNLLFKRRLKKIEHVGIWGWNSWCQYSVIPILIGSEIAEFYKNTINVGFNNIEPETGLLPHAVLHDKGGFASHPTYKCYDGVHGEGYNIDNILCWTKMAMEYYLVSNDVQWFYNKEKGKESTIFHKIIRCIDYILTNMRGNFNPELVEAGVEGDWTECTDWYLDNSNVTVNMLKTLQLAMSCQSRIGEMGPTNLEYKKTYESMKEAFNKPTYEGGFWQDSVGFFAHGNDGEGLIFHGESYFESTVNYLSILWGIATPEHAKSVWKFIEGNRNSIEKPYPVLTNFQPRTGARRQNYGKTVTNGDIWMVLGGFAAATRLQSGFEQTGSEMYKSIADYEQKEGTLHNCIYLDGSVNDSWDPENYGALFAPFVLGLLGLQLKHDAVELNITHLTGLDHLKTTLFIFQNKYELTINWKDNKINQIQMRPINIVNKNVSEPYIDGNTIRISLKS